MQIQTEPKPVGELTPNKGRRKKARIARGVRVFFVSGRPKPYAVSRYVDRKAKAEFFSTAEARDQRAKDLREALRKGEIIQIPTRAEGAAWAAFRESTKGHSWQEVVSGWKEHMRATNTLPCTITCTEARDQYLEWCYKKVSENTMSEDTYRHKNQKISDFGTTFGSALLNTVVTADLEAWLDDLSLDAAATWNNWRKHTVAFFAHFDDFLSRNPAERIKIRDDSIEEVGILTVRQTAKLFAYALEKEPVALGRLACEAFAGIRFSSAVRLEKKDLNFEDRNIILPAHKIKTRRRFASDKFPATVWEWLKRTTPDCWTLTPSEYMHLKSEIFSEAKVPHPHNCLRHSFCTYHVNAFENPGLTALLLAHKNQQQLWDHYFGRATSAASKDYWTITPDTVGEMANGEDV